MVQAAVRWYHSEINTSFMPLCYILCNAYARLDHISYLVELEWFVIANLVPYTKSRTQGSINYNLRTARFRIYYFTDPELLLVGRTSNSTRPTNPWASLSQLYSRFP